MWTIYLEFAKTKAVYDDFTNNFGKISFPIGNQSDNYDNSFKFDVTLEVIKYNILETKGVGLVANRKNAE